MTPNERAFLLELARGRMRIVEVGVFEGATSAAIAENLPTGGHAWLVDPFSRGTRPERSLNLSYSEHIAKRAVHRFLDRVTFVRKRSLDAAEDFGSSFQADLIFIDADHAYPAVKEDFVAWAKHLTPEGVMAFHDSRLCPSRPDLNASTGPVQLVSEVLAGHLGGWRLVGAVESLAAVSASTNEVIETANAR